MAVKPSDDIEWGTDGDAEVVEPSLGVRIVGWLRRKKPPAGWFNWLFRAYWRWQQYFEEFTDEHETRLDAKDIALKNQCVRNWKNIDMAHSAYNDVAWSPTLGRFAAVGANISVSSTNGDYWTTNTGMGTANYTSVCWAEGLGLFVAVADSGTNRVAYSSNGTSWTQASASQANAWESVCWSEDLGLLVAVASGGTNRVMTSPDGINWTNQSASQANSWRGVCWSDDLSKFVAVASDGTNRVMTSSNGTSWTNQTASAAKDWHDVVWASGMNKFIATGWVNSGNGGIMTSPDGVTWTSQTEPVASIGYEGLAYSPELNVVVSATNTGTNTYYSFDGVTWHMSENGNDAQDHGACWSPELFRFVVCGGSGTGNLGNVYCSL